MSALGSAEPDAPNWSQVDSPSLMLAWVLIGISDVILVEPVTVTLALPAVYVRALMVGKPSVCAAAAEGSRAEVSASAMTVASSGMRRMGRLLLGARSGLLVPEILPTTAALARPLTWRRLCRVAADPSDVRSAAEEPAVQETGGGHGVGPEPCYQALAPRHELIHPTIRRRRSKASCGTAPR